jgi:hypothetical protein
LQFLQYSDAEEDERLQEVISCDDEAATTTTDDDTLADLDQLIAESSRRWKETVHSTVQNTVTAKTISTLSPATGPSMSGLPMMDSLQTQLAQTHIHSHEQNQHQRRNMGLMDHHHHHHHHNPHHQQQHPQTGMLVEVAHDAVDDDLTVWSGFHSTVHRPDAASVVHEPSPSPPSSMLRKSAAPAQRHKVVSGLSLELQSSLSGVTRRAVFSGTLLVNDNNYQRHHQDQNSSNQRINGTGTLQFVDTGDVYHGRIVESEMHGVGTYSFANGKTLQGTFQHNVFVGE